MCRLLLGHRDRSQGHACPLRADLLAGPGAAPAPPGSDTASPSPLGGPRPPPLCPLGEPLSCSLCPRALPGSRPPRLRKPSLEHPCFPPPFPVCLLPNHHLQPWPIALPLARIPLPRTAPCRSPRVWVSASLRQARVPCPSRPDLPPCRCPQAPGLESPGYPGVPGPAPLLTFRPLPAEPPKGHFSAGSHLTPPVLSLTLWDLPTAERSLPPALRQHLPPRPLSGGLSLWCWGLPSPCPPRCPCPVPVSSSLTPTQCPQPLLSQPHPGAHHRGLAFSHSPASLFPPRHSAVTSTHQSVPQPPSQALCSPNLPSTLPINPSLLPVGLCTKR